MRHGLLALGLLLLPRVSDARGPVAEVALSVAGMNCARCAGRVRAALARAAGVIDLTVVLSRRTAFVRFHAAQTKSTSLRDAVAASGLEATVEPFHVRAAPERVEATSSKGGRAEIQIGIRTIG